jgi:hypothetical protein
MTDKKELTTLVEFEFIVRGQKRVPYQDRYGYLFEMETALKAIDGVETVLTTLEKFYV